DTGMQRWLRISGDALAGNAPLIQNRKYYFAVTAYGYNPNGIPKVLESPIQVIGREEGIRPQSPVLGTKIVSQFGDSLSFTRVSGVSDGSIQPIIVDPTRLTGDSYEVRFRTEAGASVYDVVNTSKGNTTVAEGFKNQSNAIGAQDYPVVDGVIVIVNGPALTFKNFEVVANAGGQLNPPEGGALDFGGFPSARPTDRQQVGAGLWGLHTGDNGTRGSFDAFIDRVTNSQSRWPSIIPYDFELRFTAAGGYGYDGFASGDIILVPFELWRIGIGTPGDPSDDVRMIPYIIDQDGDKTFNLSGWGDGSDPNAGQPEHSVSGGDNDPQSDWIYWAFPENTTAGDAGYKAWEAAALALPPSPVSGLPSDADATGATTQSFFNVLARESTMRRMVLVNWNGGSAPPFNQALPETGTIFRITTTKPNSSADVFAYSTAKQVRGDQALARDQAVKLINVYPNPYRGFNIEERDPANRFVTFTHLPVDQTTIQIFSLSGDLVRRIVHDNGTQFEQWDLRNSSDVPVASGIYIARIDMGGLGVKLLKLAILQAQERLDVF
ncbi:MAG: T9SS type A sorting domain-containing protein, partial [bacterium]